MNSFLQYFNLAGVLAMAALCALQWRVNREANLETIKLERTRQEQAARIQETDQQVKGYQADLEGFRKHITSASLGANEARSNLTRLQLTSRQLETERDQLKRSVTNWANAVAARDARLKDVGEQLKSLAANRNDAVVRYNELAEKFNGVVRDLNERTRQYQELVQRLNQEVKKQ